MSEIERELFAGYGVPYNTRIRVERCACGGWIEPLMDELAVNELSAIQAAVDRHNDTAKHIAWRRWRR